MRGTVHVVGAGLAGLAAALALDPARHDIVLHEAARHAGGRCRSYFDAALGQVIDNGNHLVLSGNTAVREHLSLVGATDKMAGPAEAVFDFADLKSGMRWRLRPNDGPLPWWIFMSGRRVPGTGWRDYLGLAKLLRASPGQTIGDVMACHGPLYERLWHPLLVAALNTDPKSSSAVLAAGIVRETLAKGGAACRPLVAVEGLGEAFVDPALALLRRRGVDVRFDHRLRGLRFEDDTLTALDFGDDHIVLGAEDRIILAVTAPVASTIVPNLIAPRTFRSIVNAHFLANAPPGHPMLLGLVNATTEWLFTFPGRLSVTISDADRFLETPREELAPLIWREIAAVTGLDPERLPPWRIIKEKRATFAALPEEDARRPGPDTRWSNLKMAGDWTQTGLPATIEGALRSGRRAAECVVQSLG